MSKIVRMMSTEEDDGVLAVILRLLKNILEVSTQRITEDLHKLAETHSA